VAEETKHYEWKLSKVGPPWVVVDWANRSHEFETREDQKAFVARDQRMMAAATREANLDVTDQITYQLEHSADGVESRDGEQAADASIEGEASGAQVGGQGNRQARRRASRVANRKKGSR